MDAIRAVILCDLVGSRQLADAQRFRDRTLTRLSRRHREEGLATSDYAVTAGDEFQNVLTRGPVAPRVIFELRAAFRPVDLWIALGVGPVSSLPEGEEPVNVAGAGEAFERARRAMTELKEGGRKVRGLTALSLGAEDLDLVLNLLYRLHDSLLAQVTERQWETIRAVEAVDRQDLAAAELRVEESTVSRNLKRGHYWQLEETRRTVQRLLELRRIAP